MVSINLAELCKKSEGARLFRSAKNSHIPNYADSIMKFQYSSEQLKEEIGSIPRDYRKRADLLLILNECYQKLIVASGLPLDLSNLPEPLPYTTLYYINRQQEVREDLLKMGVEII